MKEKEETEEKMKGINNKKINKKENKSKKEKITIRMGNKVVLIGGSCVGKSTMAVRMAHERLTTNYEATIEDTYEMQFINEDKNIIYELIDSSGSEQYEGLNERFLQVENIILFVFSLTSPRSLRELNRYLKKNNEKISSLNQSRVLLIGNYFEEEIDGKRRERISRNEIENFVNDWKFVNYFEISAIKNENIDKCLHFIQNEYSHILHQHRLIKKSSNNNIDENINDKDNNNNIDNNKEVHFIEEKKQKNNFFKHQKFIKSLAFFVN